jgi:hypothetical protein
MNPFQSLREYETFVYTLQQQFPQILSQPHPNNPTLASTDPHHKHVPPDIKHHRIPAPGLSLMSPNLSFLIHEIETTLLYD